MRKIFLISTLALSLHGCWAVFIPGSVIDSASDAITGSEGKNCVGESATVGSRIQIPGQPAATVKSLSGTSVRCKDPRYPIRAALVFDN